MPNSPIICQFAQPGGLASRDTDQISMRSWRLHENSSFLLHLNYLPAAVLPPMSLSDLDRLMAPKDWQTVVSAEKRLVLSVLEPSLEILVTSFVLFI